MPRPLPLGEVDANVVSRRRGRGCSPQRRRFHRKQALQGATSPSQALTRQIPPFVTCGDIFPRSGGSLSSKGEPLAKPVTWHLSRKLYRHAKASPFGRGGCERSEQTERARLLPRSAAASTGSRRCRSNLALSGANAPDSPFVTCGDIFPGAGKSFLKGRASGETGHLTLEPEALPPCQGLSLWERWMRT